MLRPVQKETEIHKARARRRPGNNQPPVHPVRQGDQLENSEMKAIVISVLYGFFWAITTMAYPLRRMLFFSVIGLVIGMLLGLATEMEAKWMFR